MASEAAEFCQRHGLELHVRDAAQLYAAAAAGGHKPRSAPAATSADEFMANYFTAVACGQHVLWRHYSYVTGTHLNRKSFLNAARHSLAEAGKAGRLSFGDIHSLLQLLCPDFPASAVKNAWSSAVALQEWVDSQQHSQQQQQHPGQQQGVDTRDKVQIQVFWQCFEVTFLYEHSLLLIRQEAFGADKQCISLQQLEAAGQHAASTMPQHGWPVIPEHCWKLAVGRASRAATYPNFSFRDLIRALCCCQELIQTIRRELQDAATAAAAASAAVSLSCCASGSRYDGSSTSTDDG